MGGGPASADLQRRQLQPGSVPFCNPLPVPASVMPARLRPPDALEPPATDEHVEYDIFVVRKKSPIKDGSLVLPQPGPQFLNERP